MQGTHFCSLQDGALLCFDEVMTGFRVARGGAQDLYGIAPDLTTMGKIIGGGLPVGAYGGRREIMSLVAPAGPVYQAGTLSGNPLAMVAGIETLRQLTPGKVVGTGHSAGGIGSNGICTRISVLWVSVLGHGSRSHMQVPTVARADVYEHLRHVADRLVRGLQEAAGDSGHRMCSSSLPGMFGFFFCDGPVRNFSEAKKADTAKFAAFHRGMLDRGVYLAPSQFEAGFTSLAHTTDDIDRTVEAARAVLASMRF